MKKTMSQIIKERYANGWQPRLGKKHSEETKNKISAVKKEQKIIPKTAFKKGQTAWNKGMKCIWTTERNLSNNPTKTNEKHWNWKGDDIKYRGLHKWVEKQLGKPTKCSNCGTKDLNGHKIHWANISQTYKREKTDWIRLCVKCHKEYDSKK